MPPFWKSLLGQASAPSASASASASATSSAPLRARGASSSNSTAKGSSSSSSTGTSTSSKQGTLPASSSSSTAAALQSSSSSSSTAPARPLDIPIPGGAAASSSSSSSTGNASSTAASTAPTAATTAAAASVDGGDDTDVASLPDTPYAAGHSPDSHAHKRPSRPVALSDNDDIESIESPTDSNGAALDTANGSKTPIKRASLASSTSSLVQSAPQAPQQQQRASSSSGAPAIPTTHTILANPSSSPYSSSSSGPSGLAAALSAVLPSSNSSGSVSNGQPITANGRAGSGSSASIDPSQRSFDVDDMIARLLDSGYTAKVSKSVCLKNSEITAICSAAREVFLSQPTLIELSPPVKIVGDVHGQYSDLIRLFEMCGFPPKSNYLFLGDYVDRGKQSLETILLLLCYKIKYPENFFLLRGNHECANVTRVYGFYDECKRRCNIKVWKTFIDVFNCLPITALVAGKIFCVHGGLSPSLSSMDDIRRIARPTDVPDYGLLNDLLWSDPSDTALDWEDNERGVSFCFGKAVIQDFLGRHDFDLICRAHMVVEDGYEFWNERTLVTIFSAPNYCGEFDNFASVMSVSEDLLCAFELLKPLDGPALKKELLKCKRRNSAQLAAVGAA